MNNEIPLQIEKKQYVELLNRVKAIQIKLPSPSQEDINKASKDINCRHDYDNRENEKVLLPPDLWHFREDK